MPEAQTKDIATEQENQDDEIEQNPSAQKHVLVVDDDRVLRMMIQGQVEAIGHRVTTAINGIEALNTLQKEKDTIDLILLDREMPEMDGMGVVMRMKEDPDLRRIPVIMATGSDKPEQVKEGIDAGVFYYLTKPFDQEVLQSVFLSAIREVETQSILKDELKKHKSSFGLIDSVTFYIRNINDAEDLAAFLANCYPDPERVITGIAELAINAVEHGVLGITYDEKTTLIERGIWRHEIDKRCALPENKDKKVTVRFDKKEDGLYVEIDDQGKGFDWKRYLDIDPARAKDNHGRGIAQARAISFDDLYFNEVGNVVTGVIREDEELEW